MEKYSKEVLFPVLELLGHSFQKTLDYTDDEEFLKRITHLNPDNRSRVLRFKNWDWIHGVGLYGFWNIYKFTGNPFYLEQLLKYYEERILQGLPEKNINSVCPMLTMTCLYEDAHQEKYGNLIKEWATWVMEDLPRTKEGGFSHITSESSNFGQLWDDTLFMTVLFLAKAGVVLQKMEYVEEAKYQFLLHTKYLCDRESGLWYHGWTFTEGHHYAKALWARGNCWITIAIPELLELIGEPDGAVWRFLKETLNRQVQALADWQDETGLWHTIINAPDSYLEVSGSAGFAYGMLKAIHMGLLDDSWLETAKKPLAALLDCIDEAGLVHQVSIGTPMGTTVEFYKQIDLDAMPYGQALVLLYLIESIRELTQEEEE